ncbi:hypothetical protein PCYB_006480, partial [Plasmodium cynomolgi strain B]
YVIIILHLITIFLNTDKIDICRKFLRNLKKLYNRKKSNDFSKHCNNIYYWLYYELKDNNIFDQKYIKSISDAKGMLLKDLKESNDCSNLGRYENMEEAENFVMLSIFNNNIDDIQDILIKKITYSEICSCQKFINQCVSLYNSIHGHYSPDCRNTETNKISTCLAVKSFREDYERKRSNEWIEYNLPKLSSTPDLNINIDECISKIKAKELNSVQGDQLDSSTTSTGSTTITEPEGKTVPTALGTIAGISSVLALLYKVITKFYLYICKIMHTDDYEMFLY